MLFVDDVGEGGWRRMQRSCQDDSQWILWPALRLTSVENNCAMARRGVVPVVLVGVVEVEEKVEVGGSVLRIYNFCTPLR